MRDAAVTEDVRAVDLAECCRRLGISRRTGERLVAEGRFPIPELPRLGQEGSKRPRRTYSTYHIECYLRDASVQDALTTSERRQLQLRRRRAS